MLDEAGNTYYNRACLKKLNTESEVTPNEDDISAEEEIEIQGTWIPRENEYAGWQKGTCGKTQKRQKSIISIKGHNYCDLFFSCVWNH